METGFRLGHWTVWPQRDRIDAKGETIRIKPKSMAVLECLAKAQGQVVSRNHILDTVWPGADVTDDVLTHSVTELRKAFGDSPHEPRVIETIPKKGLRLMLEVAWFDESGGKSSDTGARRARVLAVSRIGPLFIVVVIAGVLGWFYLAGRGGEVQTGLADAEKSIAVLPFVDLSVAQDQRHLADGLAEELTYRLSHVEHLAVLGRGSGFVFGGEDLRAAKDRLGADYLLDGSIRRSADRLKIMAQLVDGGDGHVMWSHTFDRPLADIFDVEDEIATALAKALRVELNVGAPGQRIGGTSNIDAYEQVLLGDARYDFESVGMESAIEHYTRAAQMDPEYAIAWQRIAMFYNEIHLTRGWAEREQFRIQAGSTIAKALALAPNSVAVLLTAADIRMSRYDWIEARRLYEWAETLRDDPVNILGARAVWWPADFHMSARLGYMSEHVELLERARSVRPLPSYIGAILPHGYLSLGRMGDAQAELERIPVPEQCRWDVSDLGVLVALSMDDRELIGKWLRQAADCGFQAPFNQAMLGRLFDRDRALTWLRQAYETDRNSDYAVVVWASYYGDDELALQALRRTIDPWLFWLPLTARLRQTEEFKRIVVDYGFVDYWRKYGWNDYCAPAGGDEFMCR